MGNSPSFQGVLPASREGFQDRGRQNGECPRLPQRQQAGNNSLLSACHFLLSQLSFTPLSFPSSLPSPSLPPSLNFFIPQTNLSCPKLSQNAINNHQTKPKPICPIQPKTNTQYTGKPNVQPVHTMCVGGRCVAGGQVQWQGWGQAGRGQSMCGGKRGCVWCVCGGVCRGQVGRGGGGR